MHNRRRGSRAPSAQPASPAEPADTRSAPKPNSSRSRNPRSRGTTPGTAAAPSASRPSRHQQQQTTVPSFSQQISSPFPPPSRPLYEDEPPVEEEVIWSSQLEENNFDDSDDPPRPTRTSGPLLSSLAVPGTQGTDLGGGVATQIWRRGMGVLGDVPEDSLEADEDVTPPTTQDKGKGRAATESDRTPTQAQVDLQGGAAPSRTGALTRTGSTVSQLPGISGLPGSFEGLSAIGGQNELAATQLEEESIPVLRYNSRSARSLAAEQAGATFDPAADLVDPIGSQVPPGPHADIVYNRSGNPIARSSGEPLRPEDDAVLGPVVRSSHYQATVVTTGAVAEGTGAGDTSQSDSQSQSQSTSSSIRRKKLQFGEYDPADDLVSFEYDPVKHGEDPNRDRTGETTGPAFLPPARLTAEQEAERARGKKFLYEDDVAGNLEFGREKKRQMVLDRHVRPLREIRASRGSASASPSRSDQSATGPSAPSAPAARAVARTTGPTMGDNPANPVLIDDPHTQTQVQTPSPELTWSQMEEISRQYIRNVVGPDRHRRAVASGMVDDDDESGSLHGVSLAQPPPVGLIMDDSDEDRNTPGATPGAIRGGTVLVPNSSGSVAGEIEDDSPIAGDTDRPPRMSYMQRASQEEARIGGWHRNVDDEQELDEDMDILFPPRHLEPTSQTGRSQIAKMFASGAAKKATEKRLAAAAATSTAPTSQVSPAKGKGRAGALSTEPSASSLGVGEGMSSVSRKFPPNQQGLMKGRSSRSEFSFMESSANPSQASQASKKGLTQSSAVAGSQPGHSRYPQPDALSLSTENSVMRSQLYSSRLAAYNAEQAGLKPGDEGYTEPPEDNYAQWSRKNRDPLSDVGSAASTVETVKGKQPPSDPFAGAIVRMPGARGRPLSDVDEESRVHSTPHVSGDSLSLIPDSQEESPPLYIEPSPPVRAAPPQSSKSSKTTDPRRRLPDAAIAATTILASSEAGPSRSRPVSPTKGTRQPAPPQTPTVAVKQTKVTTALTLAGTGLSNTSSDSLGSRSKTPAAASVIAESNSLTSGSLIRSIEVIDTSASRSDAEAQIEADLVPETQYTQDSSLVLDMFSPVIRYERDVDRRHPTVLVPATATQASRVLEGSFVSNDEADVGRPGTSRRIQQEESVEVSVVETQTTNAGETTNSSSGIVLSFELPDPPPPAPPVEEKVPDKKEAERAVSGRKGAKAVPKDTRKIPTAPPPLPPPSELIRRTRSLAKREEAPPPPPTRRPMKVPAPPKRLAASTRARTRTQGVAARAPSPEPPAKDPTLDSSPLSPAPPSPEHRERTASPVRRPKTYLKGRTLVEDSSAEVIQAPGKPNNEESQETSASLDPFKDLAKSATKTRTNPSTGPSSTGRKIVDPFHATTLGKRARPESPEEDLFSGDEELTLPPSKKRRPDEAPKPTKRPAKASTSRGKSANVRPARGPSVVPVAPHRPPSSSYRSCQQGGRVFARRDKHYFVATVTDSWEDDADDSVTVCQVAFDDESTREISLTSLYRCELREGDEVRVPGKKGKKLGRAATVSAVPSWEERGKVSVRLSTVPKEDVAVIDGSDMAVDATIVEKKWIDRKATSLEDIGLGEELVRVQEEAERKKAEAKAIGRPAPSAAMLGPPRWKSPQAAPPKRAVTLPPRGKKRPPTAIEEPSSRSLEKRRRLLLPAPAQPFAGHLFILALAVNDDSGTRIGAAERTERKNELTTEIERLGGRVVDGFEDLLNWGGDISDDADRWIWDQGDLKYVVAKPTGATQGTKRGKRAPGTKLAAEVLKLFLIADGANRNIKYMMALAAGVPCIDKGWIDDEGGLPWNAYLLPAGQCVSLHHSCSQWIDQTWYDHPRTLGSLLETPGPVRKSLAEKSILFVYPSRSGTEMEEEKFSHTYVYPSLACLMGAARVEAVHDIKAASLKLKEYDAIVYENDEVPERIQKEVGTKHGGKVICAGFSWVSDCLISGTFLQLRELE